VGHIWLIGMMGSGKTTVGAIVAERLGLPFIDIDTEVMTRTGRTIPELFEQGESVFRLNEADAIEAVAGSTPHVIATGGGAVLAKRNLELMRETGTTILLTASTATILDRISTGADRPLAPNRDAVEAISELRTAIYLAAADHAVDTDGVDPSVVAERVYACVAT